MHLGVPLGVEREEDGVEVGDPLGDVSDDRRDDTLVPEREELPRLNTECDPGGDERRAYDRRDAGPSGSHQRGEQRERGDRGAFPDSSRLLEAQPGGRDRERRQERGGARPTHGATASEPARRQLVGKIVTAPHDRRREPVRGQPEDPGSARVGRAAKLAASTQTTETTRRPASARTAANAAARRSRSRRPAPRPPRQPGGRSRGIARDRRAHRAPRPQAR